MLCATACAPRETTLEVRTEHRTLTARTDFAEPELEVRREGDRVLIRIGTTTYCRESELDRYVEIREEKGRPESGIFIAEASILLSGVVLVAGCQPSKDNDCFANHLFGIPMLIGGLIATGVDLIDFRTKREERLLSENPSVKRKQACAFDPSAGREITLITEDGQRGQLITNADGEASVRIPADHDVDVLVDGKPERHLAGAKPEARTDGAPAAPPPSSADAPLTAPPPSASAAPPSTAAPSSTAALPPPTAPSAAPHREETP